MHILRKGLVLHPLCLDGAHLKGKSSFSKPLCLDADKTVIVWNLTREDTNYGTAKKALRGHNHFVSDVVISSDGQFALSGSWDSTLRLWDLNTYAK